MHYDIMRTQLVTTSLKSVANPIEWDTDKYPNLKMDMGGTMPD